MTDLQSVALPLGQGAGKHRSHISERWHPGQSLLAGWAGRIDAKHKAAADAVEIDSGFRP
jgi:hypothetical protein